MASVAKCVRLARQWLAPRAGASVDGRARLTCGLGLAALIALILISAIALVSGPRPSPQALALKATYQAIEAAAPPFELEMAQYIGVASFEVDPSLLAPARTLIFARKGAAFRQTPKAPEPGNGGFATPDGAVITFYDRAMNTVIHRADPNWRIADNVIPFMARVWDTPLCRRIQEDRLFCAEAVQEVDGRPCQVITGTVKRQFSLFARIAHRIVQGAKAAETEIQYRLYLDPELGMLPRQIEELAPGRGVVRTLRLKDYHEATPGFWLPRRVEEQGEARQGKTPQMNLYLLTSSNVPAELADGDFQIAVPPGAKEQNE